MKSFTRIHGNLWFRDEDGNGRMRQIFANSRSEIFKKAKDLSEGKTEVKLQLVISHYNKDSYNDSNKYVWYDLIDKEFVKQM